MMSRLHRTISSNKAIKFVEIWVMLLVLKKGAGKKEIEKINKKLSQIPSMGKLSAKKYCGVIKLKGDPLTIQKQLRG
jgi:hypothetical protein